METACFSEMKGQHMCQSIVFTLFIMIDLGAALHFPNIYPRLSLESKTEAGAPLVLTSLLNRGCISLAQNISRVSVTDRMGFRSHAGFFTVDEKYESNIYFWYFAPFSHNKSAPVILWLQGGPGASSLYGLFVEIGPLIPTKYGFTLRKYHWALDHHLLFIDNPVGTGFSFTNNGYCFNQDCIAKGLFLSLQQFFQMFPDLKKNPFFITGESYAGKYLPTLAMVIHEENDNIFEPINLRGIAMGNPYWDPINQLDYGNYLYQLGLIDDNQLNVFLKLQTQIAENIKQNNWEEVDILMDQLLGGELSRVSCFRSYTGYDYVYNFLQTSDDHDTSSILRLLHNDYIRRSIHVGGLPFSAGDEVRKHLSFDITMSVAPIVSKLLSHYPIMFYSGQLDIIVAYPLTVNALNKMRFSGEKQFKTAWRRIWLVDDELAGYWTTAGNLTNVLVRNAGHMVPKDKPKWALRMIQMFIQQTLTGKVRNNSFIDIACDHGPNRE